MDTGMFDRIGSPEEQAMLNRPVSALGLSARSRKGLHRLNICTVGDLVSRTQDELLRAKNFGTTSLAEVEEKLAVMGLKLSADASSTDPRQYVSAAARQRAALWRLFAVQGGVIASALGRLASTHGDPRPHEMADFAARYADRMCAEYRTRFPGDVPDPPG